MTPFDNTAHGCTDPSICVLVSSKFGVSNINGCGLRGHVHRAYYSTLKSCLHGREFNIVNDAILSVTSRSLCPRGSTRLASQLFS